MENNLTETIQNKTILSARILAWIDLIIGIVPTIFILIFIFIFFTFLNDHSYGLMAMGLAIVFVVPLLITNSIFGIKSFNYLRKMNPKGIKMSLIPKIIFLSITSIYLILLPYTQNFFVLINFFNIVLIIFVFYVKKQLVKNI